MIFTSLVHRIAEKVKSLQYTTWQDSSKSALIMLYIFFIIVQASPVHTSENNETLWDNVRSGNAFVLMRHAIAPGTGDPENFVLGDCVTQRNLSDAGRRQAEVTGELFRAHNIHLARVFSSQWCRCMETAQLLKLGIVQELPDLNSFFQQYRRRDLQTKNMREWLKAQTSSQPLVLVTHQVNITALTDFYPISGELVIAWKSDSGEIEVLGSIKTD